MDDPETFMKSMGIGVIAGIARLVYKSHKREQGNDADAATESSTTTASSTEIFRTGLWEAVRKAQIPKQRVKTKVGTLICWHALQP